jgi:ABC-type multidrug transport system ATPase subunit
LCGRGFVALFVVMLELISISRVVSQTKGDPLPLLEQISLVAPAGHLMAVVGPTGSGKTALLNILARLQAPTGGTILFQGRDTEKQPPHPNTIGYVPAADDTFSGSLTVRETVMSALMLRVAGQTKEERIGKASHLLVGVGLETVAKQRVQSLSLPQRRRLKLAVALVSDPALVVCDEFASGLDVKSEREMVALLKFVAGDHPARVVINATRTVGDMSAYDTVAILHEGRICFHGPGRAVTHYFSIPTVEELYPRLAKRPAQRWGDSWTRHRDSYYDAFKLGAGSEGLRPAGEEDEAGDAERVSLPKEERPEETPPQPSLPVVNLPSFGSQAQHLALRRWTLFRRSRSQWLGHLVLLLAPPAVAAALVLPGVAQVHAVAEGGAEAGTLWPAAYTCTMAVFVQVLMVLGLGVRNGAREIAGERGLFERERAAGVRNGAYLLSKLAFVLPLALLQAFSLGVFLQVVTNGLPGDAVARLALLVLTAAAATSLCLGISAHCRTAERAHSRAWMLAYLNLLFAGALLAFPRTLGSVLQPIVTAYQAWAGGVASFKDTALYEPMTTLVKTSLVTPGAAMVALGVHLVVGLVLVILGLRRRL